MDNIAYKPSTRDYSRTVSLNETFENYTGGTAAEYVWNNSHLYCDAPDAKIEQAFDGNALVVRQATAATIADGTFIGLKGAGSDPTNVGGYYEIAFDMQTTNVVNFGLKVKAVHPENGDVDQATITVNPTTQTYSADCYAKVEFVGNNVIHVVIQFAAVGTEIFGGFFATTDNNAVLALDNYTITSIKSTNLPFIVTETGFESGELSPFTVETRFNADNQFLGMLTVDTDKVINGALSVYAGFDASGLTDKWGKLLGLDFDFEAGAYAIQFRYKVHAASENYFYLEVGGSSGKYVRFNGNEVVEASSGVNASVEAEADNLPPAGAGGDGFVAEFFPRVDVAHVALDDRHRHGRNRIMQRNGRVRVPTRIEHRAAEAVEVRLLQRINQVALVVGLHTAHLHAELFRFRMAQRKQIVIRLCTVNRLFTQPSQVDVRAVENENLFRFAHSKCSSFISVSARFGGMEHPCQMLSASTACAMSIYSPVQAGVPARFAAAVSTVSAGLKIMSATPSARATMLVKCAVSIGQPSTRGYIPAGVVLTISPPMSGKRA